MILKTSVRVVKAFDPERLYRKCTAAEHAVAVQAERDSRRFIPSKTIRESGQVMGRTIVWTGPFARLFYFGNVYVDPEKGIAGFPTPDGWKSIPGKQKVKSDRKFQFRTGGPQWFARAKDAHLKQWVKLAGEAITRG